MKNKECAKPVFIQRISMLIVSHQEILEHYKKLHGPTRVVLAFNGGKDAIVLFHLFRAAYAGFAQELRHKHPDLWLPQPSLVYFGSDEEFPCVTSFVTDTVNAFDCNLKIYAGSYVQCLPECLATFGDNTHHCETHASSNVYYYSPSPIVFLMGLRYGDPSSLSQGVYEPSSDWLGPDVCFMRVNPILYWNYSDIWIFIHLLRFSYCPLYDRGYTSLGNRNDTKPNVYLRSASGHYLSADQLPSSTCERWGRPQHEHSEQGSRLTVTQAPVALDPLMGVIHVLYDMTVRGTHNRCFTLTDILEKFKLPNCSLTRVVLTPSLTPSFISELRQQICLLDVLTVIQWNPTQLMLQFTLDALASALDIPLSKHSERVPLLESIYVHTMNASEEMHTVDASKSTTDTSFISAELPETFLRLPLPTIVHRSQKTELPIVQLKNIFILPGIYDCLTDLFIDVEHLSRHTSTKHNERDMP